MKKTVLILLLVLSLCFGMCGCAEETTGLNFRAIPGYTCYPLTADSEDYLGSFVIDYPAEWDGGDYSDVYGVPTVMAIDPYNLDHVVLVSEISMNDQWQIALADDHPLASFLYEGLMVMTEGENTENSKILETMDLHGLKAVRVKMTGQDFEMIWIIDPVDNMPFYNNRGIEGDLWFFMYGTDPDDAEYTATVKGIVDSFTISGIGTYGPSSMEEAPASDFQYTVNGEEVRLEAYVGDREYVLVPEKIEGKPVTSLGDGVFYETDVRCVTLPDTIKEIGTNTFGGCNRLVYAFMPDDLEVLPTGTFESCFRLMEPYLGCNLKKIEQGAFWGVYYMTSFYLPEALEEIEDGAFEMCSYLAYIEVPEENEFFRGNEQNTIVYSADGEKLIWYSFMNEEEEYAVPERVRQIYANAFQQANLSKVSLPDGLEYIGQGAFNYTNITELHIPESVTQIGVIQNVYIGDSTEPTTAMYASIGNSIKTIYGAPGSAAETYARVQGIEFVEE